MQGVDQHIENLPEYLWRKTGGVTDFLVLLRKESLKVALRAGRSFVTQSDVEAAYKGRAICVNHPLIEALVSFDAGRLAALTDIPADDIIERWCALGFVTPRPVNETALTSRTPEQSDGDAVAAAKSGTGKARDRKPKPIAPHSPPVERTSSAASEPASNDAPEREESDPSAGAPPLHHAPEQHIDRRSADFKRLLTQAPPRKS